MPKKFEVDTELDFPVEQVHGALTDEAYWRRRLRVNDNVDVQFDRTGGGLAVTITESTDPEQFPAVVRAVIRGPMTVRRSDSWGPLADGRADGTIGGSSTGLPVTIDAAAELSGNGDGCTRLRVRGQVRVKIPLVGGQIEMLAKQMVVKLVERDREELTAWLTPETD
ncbi:DUF2505 domain-containing protein [Rhodococcus sp. D2-41]|uniref:DUF2505 domain-containing protein n=1 Tax=Speluncibacter jeojiensis TaxID=2710754 RepID=A0A9X4M0V3_9ACTN|nr:DUF2505 domain-containing protein [Rhodococcus sp. D2-41]MDG3010514.1 DUF2505 domain-containing protein [Rhodococcus sp. D2-41]MDG3014262.1 DUF2505 domain-containing protein [Corynebacteriales bacterium D3-21]